MRFVTDAYADPQNSLSHMFYQSCIPTHTHSDRLIPNKKDVHGDSEKNPLKYDY